MASPHPSLEPAPSRSCPTHSQHPQRVRAQGTSPTPMCWESGTRSQMRWGQGREQRVASSLHLASHVEGSVLLQWHISPLGGTQRLALFLFLSLENLTPLWRDTRLLLASQVRYWFHVLSCFVFYTVIIYSFPWALGKGHCKDSCYNLSGKGHFIITAHTHTHTHTPATTALGMQ